jgi:hypothetical protein
MGKFKIFKVSEVDKENGFVEGQIVEGVIKTVTFPLPNYGDRNILYITDCDNFLYANQVEAIAS